MVTELLSTALTFSPVLTLTDVNAPKYGGEYLCVTVNEAGIGLSTSTLYFEPEFIEEPVDTEANSSQSLTCKAESFPFPAHQWQKKISGFFSDIPDELTEQFTITNTADAGVYRCLVMNTINNSVSYITSQESIVYGKLYDP